MHHEEIKAKLRMSGITLAAIAEQYGVTRGAISQIVRGDATSKNIAQYISSVTGLKFRELWPGKYRDQEFLENLQSNRPAEYAALQTQAQTMRNN